MSRIKGKDTKPEIAVRRMLHSLGYRFRLHRRDLPGSPDVVLPKHRTVVFVHGCFWHRHEGCRYASTPKTRVDFWNEKFRKNVERDARQQRQLLEMGWRVVIVWECELRRPEELKERLKTIALPEVREQEHPNHLHGASEGREGEPDRQEVSTLPRLRPPIQNGRTVRSKQERNEKRINPQRALSKRRSQPQVRLDRRQRSADSKIGGTRGEAEGHRAEVRHQREQGLRDRQPPGLDPHLGAAHLPRCEVDPQGPLPLRVVEGLQPEPGGEVVGRLPAVAGLTGAAHILANVKASPALRFDVVKRVSFPSAVGALVVPRLKDAPAEVLPRAALRDQNRFVDLVIHSRLSISGPRW